MSGVFDQLKGKLPPGDEGRKLLEMSNLPPEQRRLMRLLLREGESMHHEAIWQAVTEMPEADRMPRETMDGALESLARDGWLIRTGEGDTLAYEANLAYKPPSTLAKAMWSSLGSKIDQARAAREAAAHDEETS